MAGPQASIGLVAGETADSTHVVGATTRHLQVVVRDTAGYGVGSVPVQFVSASPSYPYCAFPNGGTSYTVNTGADGVATVALTLPDTSVSCLIEAYAYNLSSGLLSGAPIAFREVVAPAGYDVWVGTADTSWTNPSNWSSGVPSQSTSVFVPFVTTGSGAGTWYPALTAAASVNGLRVEQSARLALHNGALQVYGNIEHVGQGADAWTSPGGGTGYVEMMTPGTQVATSVPVTLLIGDTGMACAGAAPVTVVGIDSAATVEVNCPLALAPTGNNWLTSIGDMTVQHHGTLSLTSSASNVFAKGSLTINSDQSSDGLLTDGAIQVFHNFVEDTVAGVAASYKNFYSTGTVLRMQSSPYGPGIPQTIQFNSNLAQIWTLYAANPSSSVSLASSASTVYNIVNVFSVGTGTGNVTFNIPAGITLNVGSISVGSTGSINVSGLLNSASACDALSLPFIHVLGAGNVTPASCHP